MISILQTDVRHLCNMVKDNLSDILLINEKLLQILFCTGFQRSQKKLYSANLI